MKIKRLLAAVLFFCLLMNCIPPVQTNAATEGNYTYKVTGGKATITDCKTSISGAITIPSTLGGYPVTTIGNSAFYNCYRLTSVVIPDSVTTIGDGAFAYCDSLTGIWVDENNPNYSSDSYGVLFNKDKTQLIQAPVGISGAYVIPDSVTTIGESAFYSCDSLTSVVIPDSVTTIGYGAFYNCTSLTSVVIPDSVTTIGDFAFYNCTNLTSVVIGDGVTTIGDSAFCECGLTSVVIGDSVTTIGEYAFSHCDSLTSVEIPDSVTTIDDSAFSYSGLTWVEIPDSVTTISSYTFNYCTSLTSVVIPDSVTTIGDYAFSYCDSLTKVIYCGTPEQWNAIEIGSYNTYLKNAQRQYHDYQAATCIAPMVCKYCGVSKDAPLGHSGTWQQIIAPSCTDGLEACMCDICGATVTRPIPATHNYEIVVVDSTCTEGGYTAEICTACGKQTVIEQTEATGHSYESVKTWPTCTADGYTTHTCATCGDSYVDSYVAGGHKYESVVTAPTCTEQGYTTKTCTVCGDVTVTDYVAASGHAWSTWIQTAAPTCTAEGSQLRFCNCGVQETGAVEKLPHSYVGGVCTGCGEKEDHDHTWENGVCTICTQQLVEAIELSGDGEVTAFDAQILAEAKAGLRTLTDEQWQALGELQVSDIIDYILGRFPGMTTEE